MAALRRRQSRLGGKEIPAHVLQVVRLFDSFVSMGRTVEQLQQAVDAVAAAELDALTDGELDAELVAWSGCGIASTPNSPVAPPAGTCRGCGARTGHGRRGPGCHAPPACRVVRPSGSCVTAGLVAAMPVTAQAWAAGEIGGDHVELLVAAAGGGRAELFARDEAVLVAQCSELTFWQVVKAVQYWCQHADTELDHDGPPPPKPSTLRLHTGFDGIVNGDFHSGPGRRGHRHRGVTTDRTRAVPARSARRDHPQSGPSGWPPLWWRWPCAPTPCPPTGAVPNHCCASWPARPPSNTL